MRCVTINKGRTHMKKKKTKAKEPLKYDGIPIQELETKIESLHVISRGSQKEIFEMLEYLRTTGRFRENPVYAKSTFWQYLDDRFTIRQGTYRENVLAFSRHPQAAISLGAGVIAKINRLCGSIKTKKVIDEIQAATLNRKTPLPRGKIEAIIRKNADPEKLKKKHITDWKAMYEHELATHDRTKEALRAAMARVKELESQVERLKLTANMVTSIREIVERSGESRRLQA
jgi:hypothetical protein